MNRVRGTLIGQPIFYIVSRFLPEPFLRSFTINLYISPIIRIRILQYIETYLTFAQFDVTNAFLYNNINKEYSKVFCKLFNNYKKLLRLPKSSTDDMAIELEKALYSLKKSLLL